MNDTTNGHLVSSKARVVWVDQSRAEMTTPLDEERVPRLAKRQTMAAMDGHRASPTVAEGLA